MKVYISILINYNSFKLSIINITQVCFRQDITKMSTLWCSDCIIVLFKSMYVTYSVMLKGSNTSVTLLLSVFKP